MTRASARPNRFEQLVSALRVKLEGDPSLVLDSLVSGMVRGQADPEVWQVLHEAAARDERVADLAFAYERLIQDRKFKFLPTAIQCEVTMQAATFFADVFGDREGATSLLEQVLALVPSHLAAFA